MASWRVAKFLLHLREQINARAPDRDKSSDGTIGDTAHAARASDHNPDRNGVVKAIDISNDPAHKVRSRDIAEAIRKSKDSRVSYVISDGEIFSATVSPWKWRKYTGTNPHFQHVHISAKALPALYDNERDWALPEALGGAEAVPLSLSDSVSLGDMAHKGEQGERVKKIQEALKKAVAPDLAIDGDFGPVTEAVVKSFQAAKGLEVDGIVGPATAAELRNTSRVPRRHRSRRRLRALCRGRAARVVGIRNMRACTANGAIPVMRQVRARWAYPTMRRACRSSIHLGLANGSRLSFQTVTKASNSRLTSARARGPGKRSTSAPQRQIAPAIARRTSQQVQSSNGGRSSRRPRWRD